MVLQSSPVQQCRHRLARCLAEQQHHAVAGGQAPFRVPVETRGDVLDRMLEQAQGMGANAVLGVRFTTSTVMAGAAELLAYGTAVVLDDDGEVRES